MATGTLLLDGQSTDTTGSQTTHQVYWTEEYKWLIVHAFGTFDGATVSLEISDDGGSTWFSPGTFTTFTSSGFGKVYLPTYIYVRGAVSSAGASTDVSLRIM